MDLSSFTSENKVERLLRLPAVKERTGLSRSSIYAAIQKGKFPAPIPLGVRSVAWSESAINAWIDSRVCRQDNVRLEE